MGNNINETPKGAPFCESASDELSTAKIHQPV